jgi:hypothetical protein
MDFLVNADSGPVTNKFFVLGPNGSLASTNVAFTD